MIFLSNIANRMAAILLIVISITACSAVNKALTFRGWEMYESDIHYSRFNNSERYGGDTYELMIADDNSYIHYVMDYGSDTYLGAIRVKNFNGDMKPFTDFLIWSSQSAEKRKETVQTLASSSSFLSHDFSIAEDRDTHEPLLIITRDPGLYLPVKIYAMDKKAVAEVILYAFEVKRKYEMGIKNKTAFDDIGF